MPADQAASYRGRNPPSDSTASAIACSWSSCEQREQRLGEPREVPLGDDRLVAVGVAPGLVDRAVDRRRVEGVHEGARAVVDGLARDRHVVGVHHPVDEADQHPPGDQRRLRGHDRLEQREVRAARRPRRRGWCRAIAWSARRRSRSRSSVARAYWKLPTRRWLLATRASTAPGIDGLAAHRPAGGHHREGAGGRDAQGVHALADDVLAQHRAHRGQPVAAARERRAARALEVQVAQAAVGGRRARRAGGPGRRRGAGSSRRTGARRRPAPPARHRRGRGCRPAAAARRGAQPRRVQPEVAGELFVQGQEHRPGASAACQGSASSGSTSAKRWPRRRTGPAETLTPRAYGPGGGAARATRTDGRRRARRRPRAGRSA